jgi:hypothetical protein
LNAAPRSGKHACIVLLYPVFIFLALTASPLHAQNEITNPGDFIRLVSPDPQQVAIAKKPRIVMTLTRPVDQGTLLVMLDGTDITQVMTRTADGFAFKPIQVLEPGLHTLAVSATSSEGETLSQAFNFTTRHNERYEKAYSRNQLTVLAQKAFAKSDNLDEQVPDRRVEGNLNTLSQLKDGGLDVVVNANVKYVGQDIPTVAPEKQGIDLIDYLITAEYIRGNVTTHVEIGDTLIDLSSNTLSYMNRRGAQLSLGGKRSKVGGFSVNSAQTYGYDGESGIDGDTGSHIHGVYGDLNFLDNRLRMRAIYTHGGEQGDSFGTTATDRHAESNTAGLILATDFFEGRLASEFEADFNRFDEDTTDDQAFRSDSAYRLNVQGGIDRYTYGATYKYFGANYEVVGNQGLEKDRQGVELNGGAGFEKHGVSLAFSNFRDNVDMDETRPVVQTQTGMVDYAFTGLERFPITLSYQLERSRSSREPAGTDPVDYAIDSLSSSVSFLHNQWNIMLQGTYALMDDKTINDADTTNTLISFMPQFYSEYLAISPNLSYNRTEDHAADIVTDMYTVAMDIQGRLPNNRFRYGLGGTLDFTTTSDDYVDQQTTTYHFNLEYELGRFFRGSIIPAIGLRGESNLVKDRVSDVINREYVFMVTFSANAMTSF